MTDNEQAAETDSRRYPNDRPPYDDEISLFDLWAVLVRRRWVMAIVFVLVVLIGLAYTATRQVSHQFWADVSIGRSVSLHTPGTDPASRQYVEEPLKAAAEVAEAVNREYVPAAKDSVGEDARSVVRISASEIDDERVRISAVAPTAESERATRLIQAVIEDLLARHEDALAAARQRFQLELDRVDEATASLEARRAALKEYVEQLERNAAVLEREYEQLQGKLDALEAKRAAPGEVSSAAYQAALSAEIASLRERLGAITESLWSRLPEQRNEAAQSLATIRAELASQTVERAAVEARLERFSPTALVSDVSTSGKPIGTSATVVIALTVVLGAMLAVFAAFGWEFVSRANAYARESEKGEH